jgi:hypothetical protein
VVTSATLVALALGVASQVPPIGVGPAFQPPAVGPLAAPPDGSALAACRPAPAPSLVVHLELFARRQVVLVPAGIGVRAPRRAGAYVVGGRCYAPLWTVEPTGVVHVERGRLQTLGDLFAVWRMPLSRTRLAGFRSAAAAPLLAYVGGRRWRGPPARIPLRRHAEIVLELGGRIAPHSRYLFPKGL